MDVGIVNLSISELNFYFIAGSGSGLCRLAISHEVDQIRAEPARLHTVGKLENL